MSNSTIQAAIEEKALCCELSHLSLLQLSGPDALSFLQGQVTNDVKLLSGSNAHYTGYCSAKGRLLALFLAFAIGDDIYLQLPKSLIAPIAKRLKMYVLRSKVQIQEVSDTLACLGISGAEGARLLATQLGDIPRADFSLTHTNDLTALKLPSAQHERFMLIAAPSQLAAIQTTLQSHGAALAGDASEQAWDYLEIQAGLPQVYPSTQEQFVPQMLNLDALNGINFKKGCYTGQEIVARTHYLGKVKRRTFLAHIASQTTPQAGDALLDANEQEAGQLVRVAPDANGYTVLAELRLEAVETGGVTWQGQTLNIQALPYALAES